MLRFAKYTQRAFALRSNGVGPYALSFGAKLSSQPALPGVPYQKTLQASTPTSSVDLPESADVVLIGGGVIGCSTLYHLAKFGLTNAVLLERDNLTAGTTWHTAGLLWRLRPSDVEVELLGYTWSLLQQLEEQTGVNPGYIQNGGLFIASSSERLDEYKRLGTLGKVYNIESHVLGPSETKKLYPLMNVSDVYGTLYSPMDGTIDPAGYCTALARGAQRKGARVVTGCPVTRIETGEDERGVRRVQAVVTPRGRVRTNCVVLSAGCWSQELGRTAGVKVPLCAMRHAYIVTERIEGIQNMPNVRDHDASVYLRLQGDALSVGGYEPNPIFWEVRPDFAFSLFDLDWDVFGVSVTGAVNRVPVIATTGVKSTVCGPESFTADHKPLMGETPEVRGMYLACGFNSAGMMLSGGCGREMATWIVKGRPRLDMFGYDCRRFSESVTGNPVWVKERSHESYAKNYSIVYKNDEPLAARNQIRDVLHQTLLDQGCVYQERQGFERPGWFASTKSEVLPYDYYGSYGHQAQQNYTYADQLKLDYTFGFPRQHDQIGRECSACRQSVALFNMSYFGKAYLTGPEAGKCADWLFTANVARPPGSTVYTCILNKAGGTEADLTVSVLDPSESSSSEELAHSPKLSTDGPSYYIAIGGAVSQYVMSYIRDVIHQEKFNCQLIDHSTDMVLLSLQGQNSRNILQKLTSTDLSNEAFPFSTHKVVQVANAPCRALRVSFVGELGWELHVPNSHALTVYRAIMDVGKQYGIANAGYRAIDSLSLEKGYRHWHADLRSDDTPLEAGLGFTCKLKTNTPFLGRTALEQQAKSGLTKRIGLFSIDDSVMLNGLEAIVREDRVVGFLRRAGYGYTVGKSLGYGYVTAPTPITADYLQTGNYELEQMGKRYKATYHAKPLFDPDNRRVKGFY